MQRLFDRWEVRVRVDSLGYFLVFGCEEEDALRARECCRHFRDNETKFERRFILRLNAAKKDGA